MRRAGSCSSELGGGLHVLLTPWKSRVVAGTGLEGGQVAVLHLHVMALSQIAIVS